MALYLVTGGAGFIGSHLAEEILTRGHRVRVLDNFSTGKRENLGAFEKKIEVVEGDIRSFHLVRESVAGVDYILHQAALPSVPRSIKDPITTNEVNVVGTLNILHSAKDAGVRRVVFASSSSIYGDSEQLPKVETMPAQPLSPYAVSKLAAERYCQVFARIYGLETVCLRYFNVFGPRQDPNSQYSAVIPKFIQALHQGRTPLIHGDGTQSRDFTFIKNVVNANLLACEAPKASGEVMNCATHIRITLNELVTAINRQLGTTIRPEFGPVRAGDVKHSYADIAKAKSLLNYDPAISFEDGLAITIRSMTA